MDSWTDKQLRMMELGGNSKLLAFFTQYGLPSNLPIKQKYESPHAAAYKEKLKAEAEGLPWTPPSPSQLKITAPSPQRTTPTRLENKWHGQGGGMGNQSRGPTSMGNTPNRRTPPPSDDTWFSYLETGISSIANVTMEAAKATGDYIQETTPGLTQSIKDTSYQTWSAVSTFAQPYIEGEEPPQGVEGQQQQQQMGNGESVGNGWGGNHAAPAPVSSPSPASSSSLAPAPPSRSGSKSVSPPSSSLKSFKSTPVGKDWDQLISSPQPESQSPMVVPVRSHSAQETPATTPGRVTPQTKTTPPPPQNEEDMWGSWGAPSATPPRSASASSNSVVSQPRPQQAAKKPLNSSYHTASSASQLSYHPPAKSLSKSVTTTSADHWDEW
eukprot:CAMPEP_0201477874 /NCGR_PEP_ID=MMETSP0151_2-20130828/2814_1 /ASSEMBLY_ACC=CAM_ASM_000257 /TAXON_ID=200890 /ORGANISM="Paramoeba atlantica, Strain 621/1 / CCAP 1560/9" /LENGTH=382 /DNA_ID=CAMNT_0047858741 /DNA_START=775 /DNA_END=1923 /DNA_ORIENTATION=+